MAINVTLVDLSDRVDHGFGVNYLGAAALSRLALTSSRERRSPADAIRFAAFARLDHTGAAGCFAIPGLLL